MGGLDVSSPSDVTDYDLIAKEAVEGAKGDESEEKVESEEEEVVKSEGEDEEEGREEVVKTEGEEEEKKEEVTEEDLVRKSWPGRPTVKAIEDKHPGFFKDFPSLRHAFFREQEYTKVFSTVEDAQEAKERVDELDTFTDLVSSGDVKGFLDVLGETDREMPKKFATNFLPGLYKSNADLYYSITTPLLENFLRGLHQHGAQSGDDNVKNAALQAALWAFGDKDVATGKKSSVPSGAESPSAEKTDLEREKAEFYAERFVAFRSDAVNASTRQLRASVVKGFDPDGVFNVESKAILVDRILSEVDSALEDDEEHMARMKSVWKRAAKAGYAGDWKSRITSAYLERARSVMPAIRQRIVKAFITTKQGESERLAEQGERGVDRKEVKGSHSPQGGRVHTPTAKEIDWDRTSDLDLLQGKITTKKIGA
jgi:hypothetical protein